MESQEGEQDEYVLIAKIDNSKCLVRILQSISFKELVTVNASENGLKFTVEDSKCLQASAFVQSSLFESYVLKEESVSFTIPLGVLLECLNIFGSGSVNTTNSNVTPTALKMCYAGYGNPLVVYVEENGVLTDCLINTHDANDIVDFDFSSNSEVNKVILKSDTLKDMWSDLDPSSEILELTMSPKKPFFQLSTFGIAGEIHIEIAKDSEAVDSLSCTQTLKNKYKMSLIKSSLKALNVSSRVSIRTDIRGLLCMQYMIITDGQNCFVEFLCLPNEDVED